MAAGQPCKKVKLDLSQPEQAGESHADATDEHAPAVSPVSRRDRTFAGVFRSKGTAWIAREGSADAAFLYASAWSQAGRQVAISRGGAWWATVPEEVMRQCLPNAEAYAAEASKFEGEDGDRRQELVFIGANMDEGRITAALDACLLSSKEMQEYREGSQRAAAEVRKRNGPFRFVLGARVECLLGGGLWCPGRVVAHYYREEDWEPEFFSPYQVALDIGHLIHAPVDDDSTIRAL